MIGGRSRPVRPELSRGSWRRVRERVKQRDGHCCTVCGSDGLIPAHASKSGRWIPTRRLLVVGHIVPAERYPGHHDDPRNLRTMCSSCNNSQRDLDDDQWRVAKDARAEAREDARRPARPFSRSRRTIFSARPRAW